MSVVLFEVGPVAKMRIIGPVLERLEGYGIRTVVLSTSELNPGRPTEFEQFRLWGITPVQACAVLPSSSVRTPDWYLFMIWLRRNADRFLTQCGARVLVTLNDRSYPHHFFIDAANRLGIPTILLQEALRKDEVLRPGLTDRLRRTVDLKLFGISSRLRMYGQGGCSVVAAWGHTSRDYFLRVGVPEQKITVTGNPGLDHIPKVDWSGAAVAVGDALGIKDDELVIAFFTSRLDKQGYLSSAELHLRVRRFFRAVAEFSKTSGNPRLRLVVKVKAANQEEPALYRSLLTSEGLGEDALVVGDIPVYDLAARSVGAVIFSSTVGLEAALLGCPVGVLDAGVELDNWGFARAGVATPIGSDSDVHAFLAAISGGRRAELGEQARQAAQSYLAHLGTASEEVATLIAETIGTPVTARI